MILYLIHIFFYRLVCLKVRAHLNRRGVVRDPANLLKAGEEHVLPLKKKINTFFVFHFQSKSKKLLDRDDDSLQCNGKEPSCFFPLLSVPPHLWSLSPPQPVSQCSLGQFTMVKISQAMAVWR